MSFNSTPQELIEQNINGVLSVHESWKRTPLNLIGEIINGFAFKSSEFNVNADGNPLIRIRDVLRGSTSTYYSGYVPDGYWVSTGDLIVGMDGDFNSVIWKSKPALLNQRVCKINIDEKKYSNTFFFYALPGYLFAINANTSSTTVKHLSSKTLLDTLFPLPPLAEQKIIADKLDNLLARVESIKTRLENIPEILKKFRQSVLSSIIIKYSSDKNSKEQFSTSLGSISEDIRYGTSKKCSETEGDTAVLRIPNIGSGHIIDSNLKYAYFDEKELSTLSLKKGDLLLIRSNGSVDLVGKVAMVSEKDTVFLYAGYLIRIRLNLEIAVPEYVTYCLQSPQIRQVIENIARSTSGVNNINSKELSSLILPIPSLEEQNEIIKDVDKHLSCISIFETMTDNALSRINNLTQSILAKAFRGELTAQWREENPDLISGLNSAEALLEKITAEKLASGTVKKRAKKTSH